MEWPHQENISNPLDGHFTEELDKRTQNISQAKTRTGKERPPKRCHLP